jgi:VCBS repeat-containing protein
LGTSGRTNITSGGPIPIINGTVGTSITGKLNWTDARPGEIPDFYSGSSERGFSLKTDGSFTLDTRIAAYQTLGKGDTQEVQILLGAQDSQFSVGFGLTLVVTGAEDAPYAQTNNVAVVKEGRANDGSALAGISRVSGNVLANDNPGSGAQHSRIVETVLSDVYAAPTDFTLAGKYGLIRFSKDGSFTYALDNADRDTQALPQGTVVYETFGYTTRDVTGSTPNTSAQLSIMITGTNDAPVAVDDGFTAYAGLKRPVASVAANDKDDDLSTPIYSVVGVAPAGVTLDSNGSATIDARVVGYKGLTDGQSETVTLSYMMTDQFGLGDLRTVLITIQGVSWG